MTKNEFKPGDLVFEVKGDRITVGKLTKRGENTVRLEGGNTTYIPSGYALGNLYMGKLFHATSENRVALVTLYGEDVVPQIPLRGSDLTKKLLEKQKYVLCFCSDTNDTDCLENKRPLLITRFEDGYFYEGRVDDRFVVTWKCAVPVDMNGNEITEYEE